MTEPRGARPGRPSAPEDRGGRQAVLAGGVVLVLAVWASLWLAQSRSAEQGAGAVAPGAMVELPGEL
ncbi:MAG: hypothetical protein R3253_17105, partial [Longimicrobiales bacterium]|nr:hypothetical protein [Longimicrobiales bacterium]